MPISWLLFSLSPWFFWCIFTKLDFEGFSFFDCFTKWHFLHTWGSPLSSQRPLLDLWVALSSVEQGPAGLLLDKAIGEKLRAWKLDSCVLFLCFCCKLRRNIHLASSGDNSRTPWGGGMHNLPLCMCQQNYGGKDMLPPPLHAAACKRIKDILG